MDCLEPNTSNTTDGITDGGTTTTLSFGQALFASALLTAFYLLVLAANLGLVWYERVVPDAHRTLVNKTVALASLYNAGFATVLFPAAALRLHLPGGLGGPACDVLWHLGLFSMLQVYLVHNELAVLRYVYLCRLSTVGALDEGLLMAAAVSVNAAVGGLAVAVVLVAAGTDPNFYQTCAGDTGLIGITQLLMGYSVVNRYKCNLRMFPTNQHFSKFERPTKCMRMKNWFLKFVSLIRLLHFSNFHCSK